MAAVFRSAVEWLLAQTPAVQRIRAAREAEQRQYNAGARIADDLFCPGCRARGYRGYCPRCER